MAINYLDIFLVILILVLAVRGYRQGFFRELVGFIGVFIALALALRGVLALAPAVGTLFQLSAGKSAALVFFAVFTGILFLLRYAENWVYRNADLKITRALNKALGGSIGLLKGGIVASLVALLLSVSPFTGVVQRQVETSTMHGIVEGIAPFVYDQLSGFIPGKRRFVTYLEETVGQYNSEMLDRAMLELLLDLGSDQAAKWMEKATK